MTIAPQTQTTIYEQVVDDPTLEELLERREAAKAAAAKTRKAYKEVDDQAKGRIRELELGDTPARIGRFVVGESTVAGRSVAFDTEPTTRVSIRIAKDAF